MIKRESLCDGPMAYRCGARQAIQGVLPLQQIPLVLTFEGDMTEVTRYTNDAHVPMLG